MTFSIIAELIGLVCLAPLIWAGRRSIDTPDTLYRVSLGLALTSSLIAGVAGIADGFWHSGLAAALWWSLSITLLLFTLLAYVLKNMWRMASLLAVYLVPIGLAAFVLDLLSTQTTAVPGSGWFWAHVAVSLGTYGLVTLSAITAIGYRVQEHALKTRKPSVLSRAMPAMRDSEKLLVSLLTASAAVLAIGVLTGLALRVATGVPVFDIDHKTLFSIGALVAICVLLVAHQRSGMRGRSTVRLVLSAYLFLTIAYLGVKIVTELLIGPS